MEPRKIYKEVPGFTGDHSPWLHLVQEIEPDKLSYVQGVECQAIIHIDAAYIDFKSKQDPEYPGRPYLVLSGECRRLEGNLPYGVQSLPFQEGSGIMLDVNYAFSDVELSHLAAQGLFDRRFKVPREFFGADMVLPVQCDFQMIEPMYDRQTGQETAPVLFASIANSRTLEVSSETTDYALGFEFDEIDREKGEMTFYQEPYLEGLEEDPSLKFDLAEKEKETEAQEVRSEAYLQRLHNVQRTMEEARQRRALLDAGIEEESETFIEETKAAQAEMAAKLQYEASLQDESEDDSKVVPSFDAEDFNNFELVNEDELEAGF